MIDETGGWDFAGEYEKVKIRVVSYILCSASIHFSLPFSLILDDEPRPGRISNPAQWFSLGPCRELL